MENRTCLIGIENLVPKTKALTSVSENQLRHLVKLLTRWAIHRRSGGLFFRINVTNTEHRVNTGPPERSSSLFPSLGREDEEISASRSQKQKHSNLSGRCWRSRTRPSLTITRLTHWLIYSRDYWFFICRANLTIRDVWNSLDTTYRRSRPLRLAVTQLESMINEVPLVVSLPRNHTLIFSVIITRRWRRSSAIIASKIWWLESQRALTVSNRDSPLYLR